MSNRLSLRADEVHIWRVDLLHSESKIKTQQRLLSPEETARADRYSFQRDRNRFISARSALRMILSMYLPALPTEIAFTRLENGKPVLAQQHSSAKIHFNLSHSVDLSLVAVALENRVGIDVEKVRDDVLIEEIADHFFSPYEIRALYALAPAFRRDAFFYCWTRKEAYIKARGDGLSLPLAGFDVSLGANDNPVFLNVRREIEEPNRWSLYSLALDPEYKAALAVEGRNHLLQWRRWNDSPS